MLKQWSGLAFILSSVFADATVLPRHGTTPTADVLNGTYFGVHNEQYDQDFFLGVPFAQPPIDELRLQVPQSLNTTWAESRNATKYGPICLGYNQTTGASEDCLTLNIVRPSGVLPDAKLPVLVWIYGGGFVGGGSALPAYNLSYIVDESVKAGTPIIAVSLNYRLHCWGYLWSKEVLADGVANLGYRDQRHALHWIQENIAAFGGDPAAVTIWGESAGGNSVGIQLIAYGGRDDSLFRAAISQSGAPSTYMRYQTPEDWQPFYDAIVDAANCSDANDTLTCLRTVPTEELHAIFDDEDVVPAHTLAGLTGPQFVQVIDNDFIRGSATTQLRIGEFVKVPYIIGGNADEGTSFAVTGIDTSEQFLKVVTDWGLDNATAATFAALYPDIPEIGIPATMEGRPPAALGQQYKRVAAFQGDVNIHAPRRLANEMWTKWNVTSYTYFFDVIRKGASGEVGANHGAEVPYTFNNVESTVSADLAKMMSSMWISFAVSMDPNPQQGVDIGWPEYALEGAETIVFDVNATSLAYVQPDTYRAEGIRWGDKILGHFGLDGEVDNNM